MAASRMTSDLAPKEILDKPPPEQVAPDEIAPGGTSPPLQHNTIRLMQPRLIAA
jgi:hypothetical protein